MEEKKRFQLFTEIDKKAKKHLDKCKEKSGKSIKRLVSDAILNIKL